MFVNTKLENFEKKLENKRVAIIGLGVSNIPLIDYLYNLKANVEIFDNTELDKLDKDILEKINSYSFKLWTGKECIKNLNGFDLIFRSPSLMPYVEELENERKRGATITTEVQMLMKLAPAKIIGITGSEGKTTTTSLIYKILKNGGYNCFLGGNIGIPLFTKVKEMTPDDIVVLELSSFQLIDMDVSPRISIVTNIYPEHLNVHTNYEEYINAKKNIFKHQSNEGILILNYDNEITKKFLHEAKGNVEFFSSEEILKNSYIYDKTTESIKYNDENIISKKDIKLKGIHNYQNICTALATTKELVNKDKQIEVIKNFNGVEHRLEFVRERNGVKWYNDSIATSPASTIAGINSFSERLILLAGGSDKGLDYAKVGEVIADNVSVLLTFGPTASKIEHATKIALSKKEERKLEIINCKDLEEAVALANEKSIYGDVVLLSPASASFDRFKNFEERGLKFKEIVKKL